MRRGNYEDLDNGSNLKSTLDPLQITAPFNRPDNRDWFPKIVSTGGYLGDQYPLCDDLPDRAFLRKGSTYRLLGGDSRPLWYYEDGDWPQQKDLYRMTLESGSALYNKLCKPPPNQPSRDTTLQTGLGVAFFDSTLWGAPYCSGKNIRCDSGDWLVGNGIIKECGNNETSCTIDNCEDGSLPASAVESVKKIVVESVNTDSLRGGTLARIKATVITGSIRDKVDFYYTEDASAATPEWIFISTVAPIKGTEQVVTLPRVNNFGGAEIRYTLPKCTVASGCKQVSFAQVMHSFP